MNTQLLPLYVTTNQENVKYPITAKVYSQQTLKQQYMVIHRSLSNEQKL